MNYVSEQVRNGGQVRDTRRYISRATRDKTAKRFPLFP